MGYWKWLINGLRSLSIDNETRAVILTFISLITAMILCLIGIGLGKAGMWFLSMLSAMGSALTLTYAIYLRCEKWY